ncbi:MAG: HD domain-containing protein [Calditrichaceae bacterium]|nr:HD domain-containing protein [Calditrichaceae bacterium]MBN2707754.1 HD domain-containing protein [Calditrichaceae bacterium]RQV96389.1 MAG: HD domain-containing protein [Calditrichota bacterium]
MTREQAWNILTEYTKTDSLLKHALAVEAAMRAYALKFNEDEELWAAVGLIHDFDYEMFPDEHPMKGSAILAEKGIPEDIRIAILGHAQFSGVPRTSLMAKTLFAVDELCGFLMAVTLVRPTKSLSEVGLKSVKKKLKDKSFAAKVNRHEITAGAEELGVNFDDHIMFVLKSLSGIAKDIGLNP